MKKSVLGIGLALAAFCLLGGTTQTSATEEFQESEESHFIVYPETDIDSDEIDFTIEADPLVPISPEKLLMRDGKPPTKTKTLGSYDFKGTYNGTKGTLYTSYKFKGGTKYEVKTNNKGGKAVTVIARRSGKEYGRTVISSGKSGTFDFSNIKSTTEFWVEFKGDNINVSGTIKKK